MSNSRSSTFASHEVQIASDHQLLQATLVWPESSRGIVVFAHGSGSSRYSPRNRFVASSLNEAGFATLLLDLLTECEAEDRSRVFDIQLLAERLVAAVRWLELCPPATDLPVGLFGASTGSAAAMIAAANLGGRIAAVVSRGGRPDLAEQYLAQVVAPTLLIVGGDDEPVLSWNRESLDQLRCEKQIEVVPGATHLFEEPGALEQVAQQACRWFALHLLGKASASAGQNACR